MKGFKSILRMIVFLPVLLMMGIVPGMRMPFYDADSGAGAGGSGEGDTGQGAGEGVDYKPPTQAEWEQMQQRNKTLQNNYSTLEHKYNSETGDFKTRIKALEDANKKPEELLKEREESLAKGELATKVKNLELDIRTKILTEKNSEGTLKYAGINPQSIEDVVKTVTSEDTLEAVIKRLDVRFAQDNKLVEDRLKELGINTKDINNPKPEFGKKGSFGKELAKTNQADKTKKSAWSLE